MTAKLILHKYNRCFSFRQLIFLRFCEVSAQNPKPEQKITDAAGKNEKKPCKIEEQFHLFFLARMVQREAFGLFRIIADRHFFAHPEGRRIAALTVALPDQAAVEA